MDDHIMDADRAEILEDESRCRIISQEALLGKIDDGDTVVDIGSGTGFFTDDMATGAETVYAVDAQSQMHEYYREKGVPENVELVHSRASAIDVPEADLIVSILSLHEINVDASLSRFSDVLGGSGRLLIVDWSANAETDSVPPREKLYSATEAADVVEKWFDIVDAESRHDTFRLLAAAR